MGWSPKLGILYYFGMAISIAPLIILILWGKHAMAKRVCLFLSDWYSAWKLGRDSWVRTQELQNYTWPGKSAIFARLRGRPPPPPLVAALWSFMGMVWRCVKRSHFIVKTENLWETTGPWPLVSLNESTFAASTLDDFTPQITHTPVVVDCMSKLRWRSRRMNLSKQKLKQSSEFRWMWPSFETMLYFLIYVLNGFLQCLGRPYLRIMVRRIQQQIFTHQTYPGLSHTIPSKRYVVLGCPGVFLLILALWFQVIRFWWV